MSGTLELREAATWMPTGWIFDNVLERIATTLKPADKLLAQTLLHGRTDAGSGYVDLRVLDTARFQALTEATDSAFEHSLASGPKAFATPDAYAFFMKVFSDLKALMHMDDRVFGSAEAEARIVLDEDTVVSGPGWLEDAVLEHLGAEVWSRGAPGLAQRLLGDRGRATSDLGFLRELTDTDADALRAALQLLTIRYDSTKVGDWYAPEYAQPIAAAFKALSHCIAEGSRS